MQDIHSITGGRIFGGGGAGDRRLRPQHHQALKCPRCDSLNTKFCYYNNYNLSQPRHFCKSCRRYWTKGGVLRNVPVGGGCRKAKRSKAKSSAPAESSPVAAECAAATTAQARDRKTSSDSSSESSSLTGATTGEAVSTTSSITPSSFLNNIDYKSIIAQSMNAPPSNHGCDHELPEQSSGCGLFSEMGSFANLMTSSAEPLPFGFSGALDQNSHWSQHQDQEQKIQPAGELTSSDGGGAFLSQTVPVDLYALQGRQLGSESFGALDWQPAADQMLFDLPGAVDQAYWSQNSQWTDEDHQPGLYLP